MKKSIENRFRNIDWLHESREREKQIRSCVRRKKGDMNPIIVRDRRFMCDICQQLSPG